MNGVLTRMVARATGRATELRPRLPARFETPGDNGNTEFATVTEVTEATPSPQTILRGPEYVEPSADLPPVLMPDPPPSRSDKSAFPLATDPRPTERVLPVDAEPVQEKPTSQRGVEIAEPVQENPTSHRGAEFAELVQEKLTAYSDAGFSAPPLLQPVRHTRTGATESPPMSKLSRTETGEFRVEMHDRDAPPAPLMPVVPGLVLTSAGAAPPMPAIPAPGHQMRSVAITTPELPEIVISIGRIDLRTEPAAAPLARKRREPKPMTSLGDYLSGRGKAR